MNQLLFCILVFGSSAHGAVKKHDGPPLFIRDIYTNGKPDKYFPKLLINIKKYYPVLTQSEIIDCIEYCIGKDADYDVIQECQDFALWKAVHVADSFEEYKQQRD